MSNNILINFVFIVNIYTQIKSIYFHAFTYKQKYTTKKCTKKRVKCSAVNMATQNKMGLCWL